MSWLYARMPAISIVNFDELIIQIGYVLKCISINYFLFARCKKFLNLKVFSGEA